MQKKLLKTMSEQKTAHSPSSTSLPRLDSSSIEEILKIPFSENNSVSLLKSGQDIFHSILEGISAAQRIICIEFYIFKDDETGRRLADLLKEKSMQGVDVFILYDHFGSLLTSGRFWADMKKAGIKFQVSHPLKLTSFRRNIYRDHKKLIIIDGLIAFTGGFNIADEYYGYLRKKQKAWRDIGIRLEGPIVQILMDLFMKSWKRWKGNPVSFDIKTHGFEKGVKIIPIFASTPGARRRMRRLFIKSIRHAEESIFITTAYFLPGRRLLKALQQAAARGVKLKLLLPGKSDVVSVYYASRAHYRRLLRAGVEIYNYQGTVLHSKTAVFDGRWSIIGSTNLDLQSLRRNDEGNVGILDKKFADSLIKVFNTDLEKAVRIDLDTWSERPLHQKILEKVFSFVLKHL
jgi:cardiolipin synthase